MRRGHLQSTLSFQCNDIQDQLTRDTAINFYKWMKKVSIFFSFSFHTTDRLSNFIFFYIIQVTQVSSGVGISNFSLEHCQLCRISIFMLLWLVLYLSTGKLSSGQYYDSFLERGNNDWHFLELLCHWWPFSRYWINMKFISQRYKN